MIDPTMRRSQSNVRCTMKPSGLQAEVLENWRRMGGRIGDTMIPEDI